MNIMKANRELTIKEIKGLQLCRVDHAYNPRFLGGEGRKITV
jgi:hypothetical protein